MCAPVFCLIIMPVHSLCFLFNYYAIDALSSYFALKYYPNNKRSFCLLFNATDVWFPLFSYFITNVSHCQKFLNAMILLMIFISHLSYLPHFI